MNLKACLAAVLVAVFPISSVAATVDYSFTFSGSGQTVSGRILGLDDSIVGPQLPTTVRIDSSTLGGVGIYTHYAAPGFTITSGQISAFWWAGSLNNMYSLTFQQNGSAYFECQSLSCPSFFDGGTNPLSSALTITRLTPLPAVPLPAGGLLLLTALGGLAGLKRHRARA